MNDDEDKKNPFDPEGDQERERDKARRGNALIVICIVVFFSMMFGMTSIMVFVADIGQMVMLIVPMSMGMFVFLCVAVGIFVARAKREKDKAENERIARLRDAEREREKKTERPAHDVGIKPTDRTMPETTSPPVTPVADTEKTPPAVSFPSRAVREEAAEQPPVQEPVASATPTAIAEPTPVHPKPIVTQHRPTTMAPRTTLAGGPRRAGQAENVTENGDAQSGDATSEKRATVEYKGIKKR